MKYLAIAVLVLAVLAPAALAQQEVRDVVHLKNGSIIKGQIVELVPNEKVRIETSDGSVFVFPMDEVIKIEGEPVLATPSRDRNRKNPFGAAFMSSIIPGLGQYYNGQVGKGLAQQGLVIAGALIMANGAEGSHSKSREVYHAPSGQTDGFGIGLAIIIITDVWSIWDASATANRINEEIDREQSRVSGVVPELGLQLAGDSVGVELAFRF